MGTLKPLRALLAAFVLLVGITSTEAVDCSSSLFAGVVTTCDCPIGTGPSGSFGRALPADAYGGAANALAASLTSANLALKKCTDLLPGFKMAASTATPVACVLADGYCPGYPGAFPATDSIITSGSDTAGFGTPVIKRTYVVPAATFIKSTAGKPIPTNMVAGSGPFTMENVIVTNGFYVNAAAGAGAATAIQCPAKKVCPTGMTVASSLAESLPVDCIAGGGNTNLIPGGFICPLGTYGTLGTTLAASKAALTGLVICGAGSGPKADGTTCDVLAGYYGATSAVGTGTPKVTPAQTACPTGITGNGGASLKLACTAVKPGYTILTNIVKQATAGAVTALTTGITTCADNKFCPGGGTIAFEGLTSSLATYGAVAKLAAATKCPTGIGNTLTGATAQGANAVSYATACVDLLENYAIKASVGATTAITSLVEKCAAGQYGCGGSAGLFVDYTLATNTLATTTGLTATGSAVVTGANTLAANLASSATGTVVKASCPGQSTNVAAGANDLVSKCLTKPGSYVDYSDLTTTATCPKGQYCPGSHAVGTAGGNLFCPTGSTGPSTSSVVNSHISDCTVNDGFYIASGAVNVPVPCLTANICAGGGPVGTAGGSVACPTDSTNTACAAAAAPSTSTTVNLTPASQPITVTSTPTVAAAAAPDVTVTNTVPSASSASTTVASMVLMAVSAFVVAF